MDEKNSDEQRYCTTCGAEISAEAPEGVCPRCVLQGAADDFEQETVARTTAFPGMAAPSAEEIREAFPQFEVLEPIGSGGMGAVFKVKQPRLDRVVALKVLPRHFAENAEFAERFHREARALAKLNHPNIVAVHDFGESGGFPYLLMEFVDGANLRQAMQAGRCTPEEAFAVVPEICAALQYAHDEGVLHRDIKPENLLLDTRGRVKIADFGIAKLVGEEAGMEAALTGSLTPGTPQYMAPEQLERTTTIDHRADIYSLGVVFYEMLTGELPIGRFAAPSEKAGVGGTVDDIVFRSLAKEPEQRQQSAGEVKTEIEGAAGETPPAPPVANTGSKKRRRLPKPALAAMLLASALLLSFSSVVIFQLWQIHHRKGKAELQAQLDQEKIAAKAEESKLRIRAVSATNARAEVPEMERLGYIEEHNEAVSNLRTLDEEHQAIRRERENSFRVSMMIGVLAVNAIGLISAVMVIVAIVLLIQAWRTRRRMRRQLAA